MKLSKIKKVLSGTVSALMIASAAPVVASAADQQTRGNVGGYDYEMWNQNGQGQASMNPGAGSFTCSWSNIENFLARMGKNYDSQKKNYKAFGNIVLTYDVEYTPRGNSYMCVYGWTRNPLMEYYIVEGWGDWRPPGNDGEVKGTVSANGNTYDIRKTMRYNQPSLDGTATFPQYWSVRQTSGSANNQTNYMKGTIDVTKHFDAWSAAGLDMSGTLYEVSLNIEGYRSNGSANVKSVSVTQGGSSDNGGQQQNNDWNQQNNNQQQNNDWNNWGQQNNDWNQWNNQGQQNNDWNNWGQQNNDWNQWNNQGQQQNNDWNNWGQQNNDWNQWNNQGQQQNNDWNNWGQQNNDWNQWNNQGQQQNNDWNNWGQQNNDWNQWNNQNNNQQNAWNGWDNNNNWNQNNQQQNNWDWNNQNNWNNNQQQNNDWNQWNNQNNWNNNQQQNNDWNQWNNQGQQNNDWNQWNNQNNWNQNNNQQNAWNGWDNNNNWNQWDQNNQWNNQQQNNTWDWNNQNNWNNNQQNNDWNQWNNQGQQQNNDWNQWNNQNNNQNNGWDWNNQNNWNQNNNQQNAWNGWDNNNNWNQWGGQNNDWNNQQQNNDWNQWNNQGQQQNNDWNNQNNWNQGQQNNNNSAGSSDSLKGAFSKYFKIGTSVSPHELNSGADFLKKHYNSITPENELKPESILDQGACQQKGNNVNTQISLSRAAQTLKFCEQNGIALRGHTFVWYSQTPDWFFRENFSQNGAYVSKDIMNQRLESMIKNTFAALKSQYPNLDVYSYDVCNELFLNNGGGMRGADNSNWVKIYGDDSFVINAFKYARQYAPAGCKLYLNDYNEYIPAKTNDIYNMAMKLKQLGYIDGIGMQSHLATNYPDANTYETALKKFLSTGLEVQITELDITCTNSAEQADLYEKIFKLAMQNSAQIPAVTIWGTQDTVSWRSSQNPLLFSAGYQPKPAYDRVMALAK
uniref:Bifunctional endo-1,4-beta-xylanase XylA n=2 Tax=Ruminococcus flavefaciens TaxID=1265 RepID=XYNA_RUMFL|nr:RecName: Full=Bifunctional endo-1,4-beta-xylanase XylA; Flags: Precursor [Ruminococcus flavefaciens]CAA77476.1 XYLA of Ruminococcus flavefaciens [Ruminococcus flavefaciens 17]